MKIIDTHCDTMLACYLDGCGLRKNDIHIDVDKLIKGGCMAQFFALFISSHEIAEEDGITLEPYPLFLELCAKYEEQISQNSEYIGKALTVNDILSNQAKGKMSSILTVEDGVFIGDRMERVDEAFDRGVRLITLTWNYENTLAHPCADGADEHGKGLKPFGIEVLDRMNRLGIIPDVSHLSEGGFYDVARYSTKPFMASHSCARALCDHRRNLWDEQLAVLGERGGVACMNFHPAFVSKGGTYSKTDDIAKHIVHMVNKAGIESVGLGSDFDGICGELELKDYGEYDSLLKLLSQSFSDDAVEKICNGNVLRVMKDNFGE